MQYNRYEEVKIDFDGCDSLPQRDLRLFPLLLPGPYAKLEPVKIRPMPKHVFHVYMVQ
jgi:hypothetical protein